MIEIVVIRDPDFDNDITVFGGVALVTDIDLGRANLYDREEFREWVEARGLDMARATPPVRAFIAGVVIDAADRFGHPVDSIPSWIRWPNGAPT